MFHIYTRFGLLAFCLTSWLGTSSAMADAVLFQLDNDKVVDTDRHYTNGVRFAYTPTPDKDKPSQLQITGQALARFAYFKEPHQLRTGWSFGQEMYTPEDVETYTPDPTDRPYAGWTYFGITMQNNIPASTLATGFFAGLDRQDTMELDIGWIGPKAKAGQVQNSIHRMLNVPVSHGWRSQIKDELGLLGTRTIKLRTKQTDLFGFKGDSIIHTTAHLGNVKTSLSGGMTIRFGGNLKEDFGPVYGTFAVPQKAPKHLTWSTFLGFEGKAVARDIFLDGNTFKDGPDVKKKPLVLEARLGISSHIPFNNIYIKGVRLSLSMVNRTREFKAQDKSDRYGSVQASFNF
ncbi:MAG: hypothetical protein COB46_13795 [Rhodospirillaceae bacterium]|nr:MAG: hypothetical protein COB46_13795 [Rhodospirillaceae bacterium]